MTWRMAVPAAAVFAIACAGAAGSPDAELQRSDLETACSRAAGKNIAAWGQPVYRSRELGELAVAVDGGDAAARCAFGRRMRAYARASCRELIPNLVASCE